MEGVILLRTGDKTQDVLKRVEAKTKELNDQVLPKDVKILPFYDRSDLIHAHDPGPSNEICCAACLLVVVILIFFLYDFRAGLIVATTIPLALLFAFICLDLQTRLGQSALHRRDRLRNPGRRRGGHGGEHLPPDRRGPRTSAK